MPFETFSNELNHALGGGFGPGMHMIVGGRRSGKTTMAIDLVARYLRQPDAQNIVVVVPSMDAWMGGLRGLPNFNKVYLSRRVENIRGRGRTLTIAEVTQIDRQTFYIGERPFALTEVVHLTAATILLAPQVMGDIREYNTVLELSESEQVYTAKILKNRTGSLGEFNITRREIRVEEKIMALSSLDVVLGDDFDNI